MMVLDVKFREFMNYSRTVRQQIDASAPSYKYIDLSGMRLAHLDMSMIPATCETLCLQDNRFRTLPTPLPPRLTALYIENNELESIPDGALPPTLILLCAPCNIISKVPSKWPASLEGLYLGFNRISTLPPSPPAIIRMNVRFNALLVEQGELEATGPPLVAYMSRLEAEQQRKEEEASRRRIADRLQHYVDELFEVALHPDRVGPLFREGRFDTLV